MRRREFLPLAAGAGLLAGCSRPAETGYAKSAAVAIVRAADYSRNLNDAIRRGVAVCGLAVKGKNVVLKPNLVEYDKTKSINTNVAVIAAAIEVFESMGAASVSLAEGPGHRRDTLSLAQEAGYRTGIPRFDQRFVDLNCDNVSAVANFGDDPRIYLPNTVLGADLIVSLAKMKTHHWAGATLSMKNFFGTVPGAVYGWPKNYLHFVGIERSIFELNRIFRKTFAIVDGIVGMEGNGPIQGKSVSPGVLVMGQDLPAVDATCCRIMGINPDQLKYMQLAADLGQTDSARIEQRGESIASVRHNFELVDQFRYARLS